MPEIYSAGKERLSQTDTDARRLTRETIFGGRNLWLFCVRCARFLKPVGASRGREHGFLTPPLNSLPVLMRLFVEPPEAFERVRAWPGLLREATDERHY